MSNVNTYDLDFTGVSSFNLIPEGIHKVRISDAEFKKAKTGSDQLQLNFVNSEGAVRSAWYSLVPQSLWKLKGVLEALGIPCEGKIKLSTAVFKGKQCTITVDPDPNDSSKLIVSNVMRAENPVSESPMIPPVQTAVPPMQGGTLPPWASAQPQSSVHKEAPITPPFPQAQTPTIPTTIPSSPSNSVETSAQPEPAAPQGNLPPWMQAAQGAAPQGNLPPWMRPQQ